MYSSVPFVCSVKKAKISPIICFSPETMSTESEGVLVDIVGIKASNRGRSCEEHARLSAQLKRVLKW